MRRRGIRRGMRRRIRGGLTIDSSIVNPLGGVNLDTNFRNKSLGVQKRV